MDQRLLSLCTLKRLFFFIFKSFPVFGKNYYENSKMNRNQDFYQIDLNYLVKTQKLMVPGT